MSKQIRLATVLATGARFIVNCIDFKTDRVLCHGSVVVAQGSRTQHERGVWFPLASVQIATVEKTPAFCADLFNQHVAQLRAAGAVLVSSGRKHTTVTILKGVTA